MPSIPQTMQAYRITAFGGPEVQAFATVPVPHPKQGELLVRVSSASVNPVDYKLRGGHFPPVGQDELPFTLGRDLCGVVVARGDHPVDGYDEGDTIYAQLGIDRGTLAEYAIVKASEATAKPKTLAADVAGAVPLAGLTAWQGLFDHGGLKAGERVLIHGGSGGVGHLAVQFAKAAGAWVASTASTANVGLLRELGADLAIDHRTQRFEDLVKEVDVVLDLVGGETRDRSFAVLKPGGILVSTVGEPSREAGRAAGVRVCGYMAQPSPPNLRQIAELIDGGKVRLKVSQSLPFKEAAKAIEAVEKGHPVGKVVVSMG